MKKKNVILLFMFLSLSLVGCNKEDSAEEVSTTVEAPAEQWTIVDLTGVLGDEETYEVEESTRYIGDEGVGGTNSDIDKIISGLIKDSDSYEYEISKMESEMGEAKEAYTSEEEDEEQSTEIIVEVEDEISRPSYTKAVYGHIDFNAFSFVLEDVTYGLPCTLQTFLDNGWSTDYNTETTLMYNETSEIITLTKGDKSITASFKCPCKNRDMFITECDLFELTVSSGVSMNAYGGILDKVSLVAFEVNFPEANEAVLSMDETSKTFTYYANQNNPSGGSYLKYVFTNNTLTSISLKFL